MGYADSFNPYTYASADPINFWDPFGLGAQSIAGNYQPSCPPNESCLAPTPQQLGSSRPNLWQRLHLQAPKPLVGGCSGFVGQTNPDCIGAQGGVFQREHDLEQQARDEVQREQKVARQDQIAPDYSIEEQVVGLAAGPAVAKAGVLFLGKGLQVALDWERIPPSVRQAIETAIAKGATDEAAGLLKAAEEKVAADAEATADLSFGGNATRKLRSHWGDIRSLAKRAGVNLPSKFKHAGPEIESFIEDIVATGETAVGPYKPTGGGWPDALWTKKGDAIVIRTPQGRFVTILDAARGGAAKNFPGGL